jgi:hypothetical protein
MRSGRSSRRPLDFLRQGVNILIVDPFPPSERDPQGIHKVIWDEIQEEPFELPPDKPLTLAAYSAGVPKKAYVEPVRFAPIRVFSSAHLNGRIKITYLMVIFLDWAVRESVPGKGSP